MTYEQTNGIYRNEWSVQKAMQNTMVYTQTNGIITNQNLSETFKK